MARSMKNSVFETCISMIAVVGNVADGCSRFSGYSVEWGHLVVCVKYPRKICLVNCDGSGQPCAHISDGGGVIIVAVREQIYGRFKVVILQELDNDVRIGSRIDDNGVGGCFPDDKAVYLKLSYSD